MAKTATFVGMPQRSTRELATNHADGGGRDHRRSNDITGRATNGTRERFAARA
jgi:hypothetical protein